MHPFQRPARDGGIRRLQFLKQLEAFRKLPCGLGKIALDFCQPARLVQRNSDILFVTEFAEGGKNLFMQAAGLRQVTLVFRERWNPAFFDGKANALELASY